MSEPAVPDHRTCETCAAFMLLDLGQFVGPARACWIWNHAIPIGVDYCSWWRDQLAPRVEPAAPGGTR